MGKEEEPREKLSTTAILLQSAQSGDQESRNALAERFLPRLRPMAFGRVPKRALARIDPEDIVQETLLRAFSNLERFVPRFDGSFLLYLRRILMNVLVDLDRKEMRSIQAGALDEEPLDRGPSPLEAAVGQETWERYRKAVEQLTESQKEAVVLFVECGMNFEEIKEALDCPSSNAARMVIARGLNRLAELMHVSR